MDKIKIENLHIFANHGVFDFEKEQGQNFYINAELYTDTYGAGHDDDLDSTVSYADVCKLINECFTANTFDLIEKAAETIAEAVLLKFDRIEKIKVEVKKPEAPIDMEFESVSVEIERAWHRVYLSIGSNMGDKEGYITKAIDSLKADEKIKVIKVSSLITTEPYGGVEQDDFINGAIEIKTILPPMELLERLHETENACGRVRTIHWGPRTLDLDIIFYDDLIMNTEKLTIPHIDMVNRQFVLEPLNEIAPYAMHPTKHMSVHDLFLRCVHGGGEFADLT